MYLKVFLSLILVLLTRMDCASSAMDTTQTVDEVTDMLLRGTSTQQSIKSYNYGANGARNEQSTGIEIKKQNFLDSQYQRSEFRLNADDPTPKPTNAPSSRPTRVPTNRPTAVPSRQPTIIPSAVPSSIPTVVPTLSPSFASYFTGSTIYRLLTKYGNGNTGIAADGSSGVSSSIPTPRFFDFDNGENMYIVDSTNNIIRLINGTTGLTYIIAGTATAGYNGDGNALTTKLNNPTGIVFGSSGDLFFGDTGNYLIRKLSTVASSAETITKGSITTIANLSIISYSSTVKLYTNNQNTVYSLAIDSDDVLYVADSANCLIYNLSTKSIPATPLIYAGEVVGGKGLCGTSGQGNYLLSKTTFNVPLGMAFDQSGILYVADSGNHRILKLQNSVSSVYAGTGTAGYSGDGIPARYATFNVPSGLAYHNKLNLLLIADSGNNAVRSILTTLTKPLITTIAGTGTAGYNGDYSASVQSDLNNPQGVGVSYAGSGEIYIGDTSNNRIRLIYNSVPTSAPVASSSDGSSNSVLTQYYFIGVWIAVFIIIVLGGSFIFVVYVRRLPFRKIIEDDEMLHPADIADVQPRDHSDVGGGLSPTVPKSNDSKDFSRYLRGRTSTSNSQPVPRRSNGDVELSVLNFGTSPRNNRNRSSETSPTTSPPQSPNKSFSSDLTTQSIRAKARMEQQREQDIENEIDSSHSFASDRYSNNTGFQSFPHDSRDNKGSQNDRVDMSEISSNAGGLGFD